MTLKADSNLVKEIMEQFLKDRIIRKKIRYICTNQIYDWEKWLQFELQHFISNLDGVLVSREIEAFPDGRMLRDRYNMFIDIAFKEEKPGNDAYVFLELKCAKDAQSLINGFKKDFAKITSIKHCLLDYKSFWCVGFHLNCNGFNIKKIEGYVKDWDYGYNEVLKLCDCTTNKCDCVDNKIGFALI